MSQTARETCLGPEKHHMNVNSLDQIKAALELAARRPAGGASVNPVPVSDNGFGNALKSALQQVNDQQIQAEKLQHGFSAGDPAVGLEQTMVAMQKAQVSFQAALTVRNRMLSAYTEIMNMQV